MVRVPKSRRRRRRDRNEGVARSLLAAGVCSIRRVVKTPERWPRIVELAARYGEELPAQPDSGALNAFLQKRRTADPVPEVQPLTDWEELVPAP